LKRTSVRSEGSLWGEVERVNHIAELGDHLHSLGVQVLGTKERLDFTERMLSAGSDRGASAIEETGSTSSDGM